MYMHKEPALQDKNFLLKLDTYPIREQFCKVVVLNFNELPLQEITGNIVSGSLTIDGSSACRRTVSLQMITEIPNVNEADWQIHTKYALFIGLKNFVDDKYEDIIWFPQGLFITTSLSIQNNLQGINISLTGKDKMCLLDGSVGGSVFAEHDFGVLDAMQPDGTVEKVDLTIEEIIRNAIHVYAHESFENIIINDLEDVSVTLLDYRLKNVSAFIYDLSLTPTFSDYTSNFALETDDMGQWLLNTWNYQPQDDNTINLDKPTYQDRYVRVVKHLEYGDTAGYQRTELTMPGELIISAGGTIVQLLDKIKEVLGEFEYYYDVYGRFIFQRKKIYHNIIWNGVQPSEATTGYFASTQEATYIYDFAENQQVESYVNKPNLLNVRNDWIIWGEISNVESKYTAPCHLRCAIDDKPVVYHCLNNDIWYRADLNINYTNGEWRENTTILSKSDERIALAARDQDKIEQDYKRMQEPYPIYNDDLNMPRPNSSKFFGAAWVQLDQTHGVSYCVDWRELLYRMAVDYSQAQARVRVLTLARDNTLILNIVDINRLINLYADNDADYSGNTPLGRTLCGSFTEPYKAIAYQNVTLSTFCGNVDNEYRGFWIWDDSINRFRHICQNDLAQTNEKRLKNQQTLYTWTDWLRNCNKTIFFSLADANSTFTSDWARIIDNYGRGVIRVYDLVPVKGLGYATLNSDTDRQVGFTHRVEAFMQEIQMWEERLSSRYEIYFTDLLEFWPKLYRTENTLSELLDLTDADKAVIQTSEQSNLALTRIDIQGALSNFTASYNSLMRNTAITTDERELRIRSAANTLWQALVLNLVKVIGSEAAQNFQLGTTFINTIALNNSENTVEIPTGYTAIDVSHSPALTQWKNAMIDCLTTLLQWSKPDNNNTHNIPLPETGNTIYNNYRTGDNNTWVGVGQTQILFEEEQANHRRELLARKYEDQWVNNCYWDPDVIYCELNINTGDTLLKFLRPESMLFWLDFIDAGSDLGKYKISLIGHRPKVINDKNIKAIFVRDIPEVLFMDPDDSYQPREHNISYVYLQLTSGLAQYFQLSYQGKSAKDELDNLLYETTYYQDSITVSCLPIYYLEPNHRIKVVDMNSGIRGEYVIRSISISLAYDGLMSMQANIAAERLL